MAVHISYRSIVNNRSTWLPTLLLLIFLWSFWHLNFSSSAVYHDNVTPDTYSESTDPSPTKASSSKFTELAKEPVRIYVPPAEIPTDNPLDDIWADKPHSSAPPPPLEHPEAYYNGPPSSNSDCIKECPIQPFDISKCPNIQELANKQDPPPTFSEAPPLSFNPALPSAESPQSFSDAPPYAVTPPSSAAPPSEQPKGSRPLISYVYSESDFGRINLQFFINHGLHDAADFLFILNGETDVHTAIIPIGRENIKIVKRANTCFDLGAHAEILGAPGKNGRKALKDGYQRFILMNASIRGPFVPHWSKECWSEAYLGRLNEKVKLVGASLNCLGGSSPHVQSMILATDSIGLSILLEPEAFGECFPTLDAAMGGEVRTTAHLRSKGYEVDVMLSVFQTEKDYKYVECKDPNDFLFEGNYFGFNVHPFETLFVKSHRGVQEGMLEKLSVWQGMSGYSSYESCKGTTGR